MKILIMIVKVTLFCNRTLSWFRIRLGELFCGHGHETSGFIEGETWLVNFSRRFLVLWG